MKPDKTCSHCKTVKQLTEFSKSSAEADGLHSWCKVCNNEYQRIKYANTPVEVRRARTVAKSQQIRANRLKTRYKLTQLEYDELFKKQSGICAICPEQVSAIDHDHQTGEVRGLLCRSCNAGLGFFKDNISFLESAITYLSSRKVTI